MIHVSDTAAAHHSPRVDGSNEEDKFHILQDVTISGTLILPNRAGKEVPGPLLDISGTSGLAP